METVAKIEKKTVREQELEKNYKELVRMTDELMEIHSCNRSAIAMAAGIHPNNLTHYYHNKKIVTKKTLSKLKNLYNTPITEEDKLQVLLKENEEIKKELIRVSNISLQALDVAKKAEQKVNETNILLDVIQQLTEKLKKY